MVRTRASSFPAQQLKRTNSKATPRPPVDPDARLKTIAEDDSTPSYVKAIIDLLIETKEEIRELKRVNNDLVQEVTQLRNENSSLKRELSLIKSDPNSVCTQNSVTLSNVSTDADLERKRSIVISGIPELSCPSALAKVCHDVNCTTDILDFLNVECLPVSVYRLGRPRPSKPRLLKVVLPSSHFQVDVLRKASSLRSFPHKGIYIRPSLTKEERMRRREEYLKSRGGALEESFQTNYVPQMSQSMLFNSQPIGSSPAKDTPFGEP